MPVSKKDAIKRILVTNDDGINADGLKVMESIARKLCKEVWVVAPEVEQSGAAHSLSIRSPLRFHQYGPKRFSVSGTPTDCVLAAVKAIMPDEPDLILSGVNRGGNVAEDISHSGTVAAAMEGALCGIRSIAFSQLIDYDNQKSKVHWKTAEHWAPGVIRTLLSDAWPKDMLFNINFPHCLAKDVKGVRMAAQGRRTISKQITRVLDPNNRPYYWLHWGDGDMDTKRMDTDIQLLYKQYVTVTPVCMDLTEHSQLKHWKKKIETRA